MSPQEKFWRHIIKRLSQSELGGSKHPAKWDSNTKEEFLIGLANKIIDVCTKDESLKEKYIPKGRRGALKSFELYITTFDDIFKSKEIKSRRNYTCNQYALYFGVDTWEKYLAKYKLIKNEPEEVSPDFLAEDDYPQKSSDFDYFKSLIGENYLSKEDFNYIKIIGDISSDIPAMEMDKFYGDLSYVSIEQIRRGEELLKTLSLKEKLANFHSEITSGQRVPYDVISSMLLSGNEALVIMGNPGIGKSTFARWLCHDWSLNVENQERIPIYFDLKRLDFTQKTALISYIKAHYPNTLKRKKLHQLLRDNNDNIVYLLDGFDELSKIEKVDLKTQIEAITTSTLRL